MASITLATFSVYVYFTFCVTEYRVAIRKELVESDNRRNGFFIDSILNQEIVKLFLGEAKEQRRFDLYLAKLQDLAIKTTESVGLLNIGQAFMFNAGLVLSLFLSLHKVSIGTMSVGDLVAVNAMLLQLQIPFNFLGYTYQEIRQSYVDMHYMTNVLVNVKAPVGSDSNLPDIDTIHKRTGPSTLEFQGVSSYSLPLISSCSHSLSLSLSLYD